MDNQVIYANDVATAAETGGANLVNALQVIFKCPLKCAERGGIR